MSLHYGSLGMTLSTIAARFACGMGAIVEILRAKIQRKVVNRKTYLSFLSIFYHLFRYG
jgi:hypothetical protein